MADDTGNAPRKPNRGQFQKGQSGNPTGRPKINPEIKAAFESHLPTAISVLAKALKGRDERLRVMSAVHIIERVLGKPMQNVNAKIEGVDLGAAHLDALRGLTADRDDAAPLDRGEPDSMPEPVPRSKTH